MAKRRTRVNLKFLATLIIGAVLIGGLAAALYLKHRHPKNPVALIAAGDQAFGQQDFKTAAGDYGAAAALLPQDVNDVPVYVKLGKACFMGSSSGSTTLGDAQTAFTEARDLDPNSKDAWGGLLQTCEASVEYWERKGTNGTDRDRLPAAINTAWEAANHLAKLDPDNLEAKSEAPILILQAWMQNLGMPQTTAEQGVPDDQRLSPGQRADQAISDLTKLMRDHPEDEKIPWWIATAKIYQATLALNGDKPSDAQALFSEAAAEFDPSIAAKPYVVALYLKKADILTILQQKNPSAEASQEYRASMRDTLDRAQSIADPKNTKDYLSAKTSWARVIGITDPARAEDVYRALMKQFPDEISVRLELAKLLQRDPSRRDDALAVLDAIPSLPAASVTNMYQRAVWAFNMAQSRLIRADIETDQIASTPSGKGRDRLIADIRSSLDGAEGQLAGTTDLLRIRGRFQLVSGDIVGAIQTLTEAADKMTAEGGRIDFGLLKNEAVAYRMGGQTGKAIELLEKAMNNPIVANNAEMHDVLAQLHLDNQDPVGARPYIEWLAVRFPTDPAVISLAIRGLGPDPDPKVVHDLLSKLPEKTSTDIKVKYQIAGQIKDRDEQIRLGSIMNQADPGDAGLVFDLAPKLKDAGRQSEAVAMIEKCEALHPDQKQSLDVLKNAVNGEGAVQVAQDEEAVIKKIPDRFQRDTRLADLYAQEQRPDDEIAALQDAATVQPDNAGVLQQLFLLQMHAGRFTQAETLLQHLSELNSDQCHGQMLKTMLLLAKQDFPGALTAGRQLTHDYGDFGPSWELYGEALKATGQLDLACQQFITALGLQGTNYDARQHLIECTVQLGKTEDARAYIKQARERYPDDPLYLQMSVQFEINWGDPESVVAALDAAIKKHPEERRYYLMSHDDLLACENFRAAKGDADGAAKYLNSAIDLFRAGVQKWPDDLRFSGTLAQMLAQNHDLDGAEDVLKTFAKRDRWKDRPQPLVLLGRLYMSTNKLDQAEGVLNQAMKLDDNSVDTRMALAECQYMEKKYNDAKITLQPAVSVFAIREKYTDLLLELGEGDMAAVELDQAIKADPTNNSLVNLRLQVYDAQGRYDKGLGAANDAILADHTNTWAYYWRGKFEASGPNPDYDLALKDLGFFRDSLPSEVMGRALLARIDDVKGDHDSAIRELEQALGFVPQNRLVRLDLLREYLASYPPRTLDAEHLLTQTLALPAFAHDSEFEAQAALLWAKQGESDKALAAIHDAMDHASDKSLLMIDYFKVLLATKNYDTLLQASDAYTSNPKTSWYIFNDRGMAWAGEGKFTEATADFQTAMDRCAIETGAGAAEAIVASIVETMGQDKPGVGLQKALELVVPRAQNSVAWKLIAIDLYRHNKQFSEALKLAESAMPAADSLPTSDKLNLMRQTAELYLTVDPPQADKAMDIYQRILQLTPDDPNALNNIACDLCDMVKPPRAKEALVYSQRAYDMTEKSGHHYPRIMDTQGWVLIQLGRQEEGVHVLLSIDQDKENFPELHYHLAVGHLKMSHPEDAQRELDSARALIKKWQAQNAPVDATLVTKIDDVQKQVDQMVKDKSSVTAAP